MKIRKFEDKISRPQSDVIYDLIDQRMGTKWVNYDDDDDDTPEENDFVKEFPTKDSFFDFLNQNL
jgi:hypothetical protein